MFWYKMSVLEKELFISCNCIQRLCSFSVSHKWWQFLRFYKIFRI